MQRHRISMILLMMCTASLVFAGDYKIPAGTLEEGLLAFSRQSNVQLFYAPALVDGKRSAGLMTSNADPSYVLAKLLSGTGLRAYQVASGAFVLEAVGRRFESRTSATERSRVPFDEVIPIELSHVQVFGLLPRTEIESTQPITVIDRKTIERSGYQTVYELLRAQPGIRLDSSPVVTGDSQTYLHNGLSGATGAASVSLHGFGAAATPVLIDGQRLVDYGLAQGQFETLTDLNSIPLALIERVEILRDGASILYGADAMAGALNIVLRKQFEGAEISTTSGTSFHGDAAQQRVSSTLGTAIPGAGHVLLSFDYLDRQPLLNHQRRWTRKPEQIDGGGGYFFANGAGFRYAGNVCREFHPYDACERNPEGQATLQTGLNSRSLLFHFDRPVGPASLYADLRWTDLRQSQQSPPSTGQFDDGFDEDSNRYKTYSFNDVGPVVDYTNSRTVALTLRLTGLLGTWNWDIGLDGQSNRVNERVRGLIRQSILYGVNYQLGSDNNSAALLAALSPTLFRHGLANRWGFTGRMDGILVNTRHGDITLSGGFEAHRASLLDHPDPLLVDGDVYQIQPPSVRSDARWDKAAYLEVKVPVAARLMAEAGIRVEHSDGYQAAASPRMGMKWNISDKLSLRGSWALGYRAPPLLSRVQSPSLVGAQDYMLLPSYVLPCRSQVVFYGAAVCRLRLRTAGNPHLHPELSQSLGIGLVFAPITRLGITLDAYQLDRYHEIGVIPFDYGLQHPKAFPQLFHRDAHGVLDALEQEAVNLGRAQLRTVDLDICYQLLTLRHGEFTFELGANWLAQLKRRFVGDDSWNVYAGYADQPRLTALGSIGWHYRNWSLLANLRYTGRYAYAPYASYLAHNESDLLCSYPQSSQHCETPAFTLVDVDAIYAGWPRWTVGVNVHNLFDHKPVFYGDTNLAYSPTFDDIAGRYIQFSVQYRF